MKKKSLSLLLKKMKEVDFLYQKYIGDEKLDDYAVPVKDAIKIIEVILSEISKSNGYQVQKSHIILGDNRKWIVSFFCENENIPSEFISFLRIVREYKTRIRDEKNISRGEMYEFIYAYKCFTGYILGGYNPEDIFECSKEDLDDLKKYYDHMLVDINEPNLHFSVGKVSPITSMGGISAGMAGMATMAFGPLGLIPGLLMVGINGASLIKNKRIHEEKTSDLRKRKEQAVTALNGAASHMNISDEKKPLGNSKEDVPENVSKENIETEKLMNFFVSEMRDATSRIEEVIHDESKEITVRLDNMTEILKGLMDQIASYQSLVENQIELAASADEIDRIVHAYSAACVDRIIGEIDKKYSEKARHEEAERLRDTLGQSAWNKLLPESQNYLISAKVTYAYYSNLDSLDYSGVCLLVTKALEVEMSRRFYKDYTIFLKRGYSDSWKHHLNDFPTTLLKTVGGAKALKSSKEFTLGAVAYVLCAMPDKNATEEQLRNNEKSLVEFAKTNLIMNDKSDDEILELLQYYGTCIDEITKNYRNKAAHTNQLKKVDAKECFELVIDVEQLLKKILDSFKY